MAEEDDLLSCLLDVAEAELNNLNKIDKCKSADLKTNDKVTTVSDKTKTRSLLDVDIFSTSSVDTDLYSVRDKTSNKSGRIESLVHGYDIDSSDEEAKRNYEKKKYNEYGEDIKSLLNHQETASSQHCSQMGPPTMLLSRPSLQKNNWKTKNINERSLTTFGTKPSTSSNKSNVSTVCSETMFGISVINPLVSSKVLEERMAGRKLIPIHQIGAQLKLLKKDDDWVVVGVICNKGTTKTSAKGNQFMIWTLSDLLGDVKTISLFLFGSAYKQFWTSQPGTVVGILNPGILDKREGSREEASLSVNNAQKIMVIGQSKDLAMCKSTKKNGDKCTAIVNKSKCEFCIYHVKQEYQKCSRRSELQSNFSGKGLIALRNKVLGKNEVFYAGKSYTAIPAKQSRKLMKKDHNRLLSLSGTTTNSPVRSDNKIVQKAATSFDVVRSQRTKDLDTLKKLGVNTDKLNSLVSTHQFQANHSSQLSLDEARANAKKILTKLNNKKGEVIPVNYKKEMSNIDSSQLQKSLDELVQNDLINLDMDFKAFGKETNNSLSFNGSEVESRISHSETSLSYQPSIPEEKQDNYRKTISSTTDVDNHRGCKIPGKIEYLPSTSNLNSLTEKISPISLSTDFSMKQNLLSTSNNMTEKTGSLILGLNPKLTNNGGTIDLNEPLVLKHAKRAKSKALSFIEKNGPLKKIDPNNLRKIGKKRILDKIDSTQNEDNTKKQKMENGFQSDRFKKMMELQSKHMDLVDQKDNEEKEKYFNKLEVKERMEEKMTNTYRIECKAVRCLTCKYTSFSAAEKCKLEKHRLRVFDAIKRFFKCGHCGNRVACLDVVPIQPCKNCGSGKWERTTMMKEKIDTNCVSLSIRGGEQKFVNSVVTDANINLLVPDD